jgi:PAS domain S-box-containing protein
VGPGALLAFTALQLAACCALLVSATTIFVRDPTDRGNRAAALLIYSGAAWGVCQLLWNTTDDPELALLLVRLSALGWVFLGPLSARFILSVTQARAPHLRKTMLPHFGLGVAFLAIEWTTPLVHVAVFPTWWGFGYVFGPLYPLFFVLMSAALVSATSVAVQAYRHSTLESDRAQARWIAFALGQMFLIASVADGVLPWIGRPIPQLGPIAFAVMGLVLATSMNRFGYSILSPGTFSREISEAMGEGLMLARMDGRIRATNGGLARIVGRPRESIEGQRITDLLALPRLDPLRELRDARGELIGSVGQRIPVSVTAWLLRDGRGAESGLAVIVRDLREIEALQRRLVLSGRMAAVGQLAAGVAHEVNNPAAFVHANLQQLEDLRKLVLAHLEENGVASALTRNEFEVAGELIGESLEGVARITGIVDQIRRFSHAGTSRREPADLHALLESVVRMARGRLGPSVRVERRFSAVPAIECAPRELEQVFLNLVLNAVDAIGDSGTIRLMTAVSGTRVRVEVEDDGCGIAPDVLERVFDPFFTTKPVGQGTGLGLAISYEIAQRHGGEIAVRSEVGRGTTFTVLLPLAIEG